MKKVGLEKWGLQENFAGVLVWSLIEGLEMFQKKGGEAWKERDEDKIDGVGGFKMLKETMIVIWQKQCHHKYGKEKQQQ